MAPRRTNRLHNRLSRTAAPRIRLEYNLEKPPLHGDPPPNIDLHLLAAMQSAYRRTSGGWVPVVVIALLVLIAGLLMLSPMMHLFERGVTLPM